MGYSEIAEPQGSMRDWNTFRARLEDAKLGGGMSFDERIELVPLAGQPADTALPQKTKSLRRHERKIHQPT